MLAGTVYFYKKNEIVKKMDMENYDELSNDAFMRLVKQLQADKVTLCSFSNNHQTKAAQTILYKENK